ncbi:phage tail termination protein [Escherichia coli]
MKRSEVYDNIRDWIQSHGYDEGYILQARFWNERPDTNNTRYIVIQQNGGAAGEEAITRDYFRILVISSRNDKNISEVEDLADAIRQSMLTEFKTDKIVHMKPTGAIPAIMTKEGRYIFTVAFQAIISR